MQVTQEGREVVKADTIGDPDAVMVEQIDTVVAVGAVVYL